MPIPAPQHDLRSGSRGMALARLVIVAMLCAMQYWLLTSTMEAFHGGDRDLPFAAAIASLLCFLLALGLVRVGERAAVRRAAARRGSP